MKHHLLRLTAFTAMASAVALGSLPAQAGLLGLSEQDEIAAGQEVAQQALKEYGGAMPQNSAYANRVRAIGRQFANLSTRKNLPYSYTVLNDTKTLNAFAAPGGPVFVTRRLMDVVSNDAELAYVLGHETAHIEHKHIVKQVEQQQKAGLIVGILGAILGKGKSSDAIGAVANVGWAVISRGYSRKDESEADATGARWMSQLGYDPRAALTMLQKLDSGGGGGGIDKYLSTHPQPKDRQAKVSAQITSEKLLDVARQHGGPRLTSGISVTGTAADIYPGNDAYNPPATTDYYPAGSDDYYYPPTGNTDDNYYYPPTGNTNDDYYYPPSRASGEVLLNFGSPLRLYALPNGTTGVVMAPVSGFARWAGATVSTSGALTTVTRPGMRMQLRRNSTVVYMNDRSLTMSAPARLYNDVLYAPLGHLAAAAGASATLDPNDRTVHLSLSGRQKGYLKVP